MLDNPKLGDSQKVVVNKQITLKVTFALDVVDKKNVRKIVQNMHNIEDYVRIDLCYLNLLNLILVHFIK